MTTNEGQCKVSFFILSRRSAVDPSLTLLVADVSLAVSKLRKLLLALWTFVGSVSFMDL